MGNEGLPEIAEKLRVVGHFFDACSQCLLAVCLFFCSSSSFLLVQFLKQKVNFLLLTLFHMVLIFPSKSLAAFFFFFADFMHARFHFCLFFNGYFTNFGFDGVKFT